jgi:Tol biopolymer transport system component
VTLVLNVGPAPAGPAFPGHNGAIVFVRTVFDPGSNSRQELFRIEPNGTGEDRLTMDDNWDQQPTWSPDGTKIAFARCGTSCAPNQRIFTVNADGTGMKQITFGNEALAIPLNHTPVWSPDGTRIAYLAEDDGVLLYVVNDDGSGRRKLTRDVASFIFDPVWSPDGREIVFTMVPLSGGGGLYSVGGDGTNFRPVVTGGSGAAWSPDGTRIAHLKSGDVWVVNRDGSNPVNLTETAGVTEFQPHWSQDGSTLLYGRDVAAGTGNDIISRDLDSGTETNITDSPTVAEGPVSWSPDGNKILFASSGGLGVMDADGDNSVPLGGGFDADWQPLCTINGTANSETVSGTEGPDVICAGPGNDTVHGGGGNDIVFGGGGNDRLNGGEGADILAGQGGNDTLVPGPGDDLAAGATGTDTVSFAAALASVSVSLTSRRATGEGLDVLVTVENATGTLRGDILVGDQLKNKLRGAGGGDRIKGEAGNDVLLGEAGNDSLNGGRGTDTCRQGRGTGPIRACERD